ncbi:MAG TPA: hypothetical protein VGD41_01190, partial [Pyrinomonadaceae bacterium]
KGFTFLGFPPIRSKDRNVWLASLMEASERRAVVFYEAPHKLRKTLTELNDLVNRPIIVARELTKIHEEFVQGTPAELLGLFQSPQGEFTVLVPPRDGGGEPGISEEIPTDAEIVTMFGQITDSQRFSSKKEAAKALGLKIGLSAKQVYAILERNKLVE